MAASAVSERVRAEAMARRLARTATRLGVDDDGVDLLRSAFAIAMEPRFGRPLDDHHPDYLHTARTALILMDDAGVSDPATLGAALVAETRDPGLVLPPDAVARLDAAVAGVLAEVPVPGQEDVALAEGLVLASRPARLVAVAERLDHARHLHLRERPEWAGYHQVTCSVYGPVAHRTDPALAGRVDWWCATFRERFLKPG